MHEPVILAGGPIRTMTSTDLPPAVLVQDGRIARIGTVRECEAAAATPARLLDLDGRTLMPGFLDAHAHLLMFGSALEWADLTDCASITEIVERLAAFAAQNREDAVIRGYGYDQSRLAERRHPTALELDRADARRPVEIMHASGHGYVVNSAALRLHHIDRDTPTPAGGRLDHDEHGEPTGVIFDAACDLLAGPGGVMVGNHGPNFHLSLADAEADRLLDRGQEEMLAAGITSICDAQVTARELRAYLRARDDGRLKLRVQMLMLSNNLEHLVELGMSSRLGDQRLELHGVKFYADGSVIARTAYLGQRHTCCGAPTPEGYLYHEPHDLVELVQTAHRLGLTAATHAQGSMPIGLVLDAIEDVAQSCPRPRLVHRIEHCGFPTTQQVSRMAALNVVPVPQPAQIFHYGASLAQDFGDMGASFYPYGAFERHGVPVVISSDAPVTHPHPLHAAWVAATRRTEGGEVVGPAELTVSRATAVHGITTTPARLLGRPQLGAIRVGAPADLVLLDGDPVAAELDRLPDLRPTETWVAGERAWARDDVAG